MVDRNGRGPFFLRKMRSRGDDLLGNFCVYIHFITIVLLGIWESLENSWLEVRGFLYVKLEGACRLMKKFRQKFMSEMHLLLHGQKVAC